MRLIGFLLIGFGVLGVLAALGMDTSVTRGGEEIVNFSLLASQSNELLIFAAMTVVGAIFASRRGAKDPEVTTAEQTKECPYCAEEIKTSAVLCKHCRSTLSPTTKTEHSTGLTSSKEAKNERLHQVSAAAYQTYIQASQYLWAPGLVILAVGFVLAGYYGLVYDPVVQYQEFGLNPAQTDMKSWTTRVVWVRWKDVLGILGLGLVLAGTKYFGRDNEEKSIFEPHNSNSSLITVFAGTAVSLVVFPITLCALLYTLSRNAHTAAALIVVLILGTTSVMIIRRGHRVWGAVVLMIAAWYLCVFYPALVSASQYSFSLLVYRGSAGYELWLYASILLAVAAIPNLPFGRMRFGRVWGDLHFTVGRHPVQLPFISALLLYLASKAPRALETQASLFF